MDKVYERIRERRLALGMTQEELALKAGYSGRSAINSIEKGKNDIPRDKIVAIANALNVSVMYLFGGEPSDPIRERFMNLSVQWAQLNEDGREMLESYIEMLCNTPKYTKREIKK